MPGALPDGEPVPVAGTLPGTALHGLGVRPFGLYVHVPFCTTRCGYCDFNTYTAAELGAGAGAVSPGSYPDLAMAEIRLARRVLGEANVPVSTVFFVDALRIRLGAHLGPWRQPELGLDRPQDGAERGRRQQGGRPAAEEHRADRHVRLA